ncbi:MAG: amidase [Anaerolineae bacterium]
MRSVEELTIHDLQAGMAVGEFTACDIVDAYLSRIDALDRQGPRLNAVIELNPDAPSIADALDAERAERGPRGPLHGIPILLKDNIDTAGSMCTTAGSLALAGSVAKEDAHLVRRLREAGAIILGKTNLSEWSNFRSTHSTSGWSSRGGLTRNPYALDRNPSGSSAGSAVAVAASLCAAAVGTETDGSIVSPASHNAVVGIKPTLGAISRSGIIPIAHSQDTAGPLARTVADAALLLGAMIGVDPRDSATGACAGRLPVDYSFCLDPDGLRGARIGVARNVSDFHPRTWEVLEDCLAVMRDCGAEIVDPVEIENARRLAGREFEVLLYEFKADLNSYLAGRGPDVPVHSLAEVIAFNEAHRDVVMPYFGQEIMLMAEEKGPLTDPAYREALEKGRRLAGAEGIDATLARHRLDAIVAPSGDAPPLTDLVNGDGGGAGSSTPAAVAGYPSISVPAGFVYGLPVGISFIGPAYSEPTLIRLAYAFERAVQVRRPPQYLPTIPMM